MSTETKKTQDVENQAKAKAEAEAQAKAELEALDTLIEKKGRYIKSLISIYGDNKLARKAVDEGEFVEYVQDLQDKAVADAPIIAKTLAIAPNHHHRQVVDGGMAIPFMRFLGAQFGVWKGSSDIVRGKKCSDAK